MARPCEVEVFRENPVIGKSYKWGEAMRITGDWYNQNQRYFAPAANVIYVGKLINLEHGGERDQAWTRATFRKRDGKETIVNFSFEGTTGFIEVIEPDQPKVDDLASDLMLYKKFNKNPKLNAILKSEDIRNEIKSNLYGGKKRISKRKKSRRHKGSVRRKKSKKSKRR
jgi:hypothetical protein